MRLAILCDVHGNLQALEAILDDLERERPDRVVIAGDSVNGAADSAACFRLLRSLDVEMLRGNHERYLFDLGTPAERPEWRSERFGPVRWAAAQFGTEELEAMRRLPVSWQEPETREVVIVHAAPADDAGNVLSHTPDEEVDRLFGRLSSPLVVRGHNHIGSVRHWRDSLIITSGAAGLPLDGTRAAQYLLLERRQRRWSYRHKAVPYDIPAALHRFRETGYLDEAGPMARLLMREVATASHQMMPCLRFWQECAPGASFGEAVDRFLSAY